MGIDKPGKYWRIRITTPDGRRIQRSTRTTDKKQAQQLHDKIKNDLWRIHKLGEKPERLWQEAVIRWRKEGKNRKKDCLYNELTTLNWLDKYLKGKKLHETTGDLIEEIAQKKEAEFTEKRKKNETEEDFLKRCKTHPTPATINRMLGLVRSVFRKAKNEWGWIDNIPHIRMRKENTGIIRWITHEEADRLIAMLPSHLGAMAEFTLATGLRRSNITNLKWRNIDMTNRHAHVEASEAKAEKAIPVPLNADAIRILLKQMGKHSEYVFVYLNPKDKKYAPITWCNGKAWRKALKRAGIESFRWHDLRHTWASWHIQNGTPIHLLKELGGWAEYEMVLRYAHLNSDQLKDAAERITGAKLVPRGLKLVGKEG